MEKRVRQTFLFIVAGFLLSTVVSCSVQQKIGKQANTTLLTDTGLAHAHIGISIFEPGTNKFLYNYQGEKYFTPASNTKLFTLYAGLKYLGDSIVAAQYYEEDGTVILQATGDPTFLHPDFKNQPLFQFLQRKEINKIRINTAFASEPLGSGWSWSDYKYAYMAERDPFPIYGNLATIIFNGDSIQTTPPILKPFVTGVPEKNRPWQINREPGGYLYTIDTGVGTPAQEKIITMPMRKGLFASRYLADTLKKEVIIDYIPLAKSESLPFYSQASDTLFKMMMHRSDNFIAEQTLLMASNERIGEMNDRKMIDTLLATDLAGLPQPPRWVDGSGLSRYNLFSPKDFVWLLNKLKSDFSLQRLQVILPGANEGTLENLYRGYEQHIYAKTGTLSNNVALSGFLRTKKNKTFIFSILVNNHNTTAPLVRRQVEKFLTSLIDKY
jgi:D-alanyl-D-alanine carboxypeptidase/D-alanyl-D-alanine-endopeptidase (penicillin-binding protein 4)